MKYYIISFENGDFRHGEFIDYIAALDFAEHHCEGENFTIEEWDSEQQYLQSC